MSDAEKLYCVGLVWSVREDNVHRTQAMRLLIVRASTVFEALGLALHKATRPANADLELWRAMPVDAPDDA